MVFFEVLKNRFSVALHGAMSPAKPDGKGSSGIVVPPNGHDILGWYYTHGAEDPKYNSSIFSEDDKIFSDAGGKPNYMLDHHGIVRQYDPDPNRNLKGKVTNLGECPQ